MVLLPTYKFQIKDFPLRFNPQEAVEAYDIYEGLVKRGLGPAVPLDNSSDYFIPMFYPKGENKEIVNKLLSIFKVGYGKIIPFGFGKMFMLDENKISYEIHEYNNIQEIVEIIKNNYKNNKTTLPIVLIKEKTIRADQNSVYYLIKRNLLFNGYISQIITIKDLLEQENTLKWSVLSIFSQVFAKLGGLPYTLYKNFSIRSTSLNDKETVIIIGLGLSKDPSGKNTVGSSLVYDDRGHFKFLQFKVRPVPKETNIKDVYSGIIENLLTDAYSKASEEMRLSYDQPKKVSVVIHYRGKEISKMEEQTINGIVERFRESEIDGEVYLLKLKDSNIFLTDRNFSEGYPDIGYVIKVLNDLYMIQLVGKMVFEKFPKPKQNVYHGVGNALLVNIRRYGGGNSEISSNLAISLLKTVFGMSRLNYVSISNPFVALPTTVSFSQEIAYSLPRFSITDLKNVSEWMNKRLWFI
jgi:hypothetical protein